MSFSQQDPAAASAPFDSSAKGYAVGTLAQGEPREIAIVAKRFAFEPARIEIAEGERVRLVVISADGVHGLQIKKLNVNTTVPRGGAPVTIDFTAAAGEYPILCSEYCGKEHADMKGTLVVSAAKTHSPAPARGTHDSNETSIGGHDRPGGGRVR